MIPVSLSGGLFLLVALWLAFLAVLWIRELRRLSPGDPVDLDLQETIRLVAEVYAGMGATDRSATI